MISFKVDPESDLPIWVQLRNRLMFLITSGYLKPGDKLPTVRGLAADISINFNTVNKAYISLMDEGYIDSKPGRGAIVCDSEVLGEEMDKAVDTLLEDCFESCLSLGLTVDDLSKMTKKKLSEMQKDRV